MPDQMPAYSIAEKTKAQKMPLNSFQFIIRWRPARLLFVL
jgi:hypothetical protein